MVTQILLQDGFDLFSLGRLECHGENCNSHVFVMILSLNDQIRSLLVFMLGSFGVENVFLCFRRSG